MVITTGVARARALAAARFATLVLAVLVMVLGVPLTFGVLGAGLMVRARPRRPRRRR